MMLLNESYKFYDLMKLVHGEYHPFVYKQTRLHRGIEDTHIQQ